MARAASSWATARSTVGVIGAGSFASWATRAAASSWEGLGAGGVLGVFMCSP